MNQSTKLYLYSTKTSAVQGMNIIDEQIKNNNTKFKTGPGLGGGGRGGQCPPKLASCPPQNKKKTYPPYYYNSRSFSYR